MHSSRTHFLLVKFETHLEAGPNDQAFPFLRSNRWACCLRLGCTIVV